MPRFIEIRDETGKLTKHELSGDQMIIGRSSSADIRLNRPTVSRQHARLTIQNGGFVLTDLDSTSGTTINGKPVTKSKLWPGDRVQISRFELRLVDPKASSTSTDQLGLTTMWAREQAPPKISALDFGPAPKIDFDHIGAINAFGQTLMKEDDPAARLNKLCRMAVSETMGGYWALVLEVQGEDPDRTPAVLAASDERLLDREGTYISQSAIRAALNDQAPVLANNFAQDNQAIEMSIVEGAGATAAVVCPLGGNQGGLLLYVNMPPQRASVAWLAVIALLTKEYQQSEAQRRAQESARQRAVVERDMENAKSIQQSILPEHPEIDGLDIAWSFMPCDAVGGDLIDVIELADGRVLIAIADVSGHGLAAALATLSIHSIVQTSIKNGTSTERMMTMLNDHLCAYLPDSRFVTMVVVVIDPRTGETQCINAGHSAPLIVGSDGQARELNHESHLVLGVAPGELTSAGDRLAPDETMLLYTDGLIEMQDPEGGQLRAEGLTVLFQEALQADESAGAVTTSIRGSLDALQAGQPVLDDQTFMVIRSIDSTG
ncbi:MAG: SpoIIE family protein phosphatase [Planctomycetota bacterium]